MERRPTPRRTILLAGTIVLVLAFVAVATALYTDGSAFCRSCHEMVPYYDSWAGGPHSQTACISCHVDAGYAARFEHKFVAMRELWVHVTGDPKFPLYGEQVPDERCRRCHETPGPKKPPPGFSHPAHQRSGACERCHAPVGHPMTFAALKSAGILDASASREATGYYAPITNRVDPNPKPRPGHRPTSCLRCHDMSRERCDYCHAAPKGHFTLVACDRCHNPAVAFAQAKFKHSPTLDCAKCHTPPANHFTGRACRDCHTPSVPFAKTVFRHPANTGAHTFRSFPCAKCHPSGFATASCTCHGGRAPSGD